jgi:murein DD-endopeptidase MepM/ murein hydrolase activator NlpD
MLFKKIIVSLLAIFLMLNTAGVSFAQSVDELKQNISSHNDKIKQLEAEISAYEKQIETVGGQAKTLQSTIQVLDINQKKIGTEITKTETSIQKTNLTIEQLAGEMGDIEEKINSNMQAISKTLSDMRAQDEESLIESFLANKSLADVFNEYESINQFQQKVRDQSIQLKNYEEALAGKKTATEGQKKNLVSLKSNLSDQNKILDSNKKEKTSLLTETKNKETEYKKILAERQVEKEQFEKELFQFESQLKIAIDPKSFPSSGKGIFAWPLDNVYITQYFGKTVDAKRLYASGTHNGVDFRASIGTPVKAVMAGVIQGTGNTDAQKGCYSYGKWVLIKHPNGLSSLYGHLSLIKVAEGQSIETGEIIGYSGQTGYATGPHLHLTVYASQGLEVQKYSSSINCKNVSIPIADIKAYLDPMLYLPTYP